MARRERHQGPLDRGFPLFLLLSLLGHAACVASFAAWQTRPRPPPLLEAPAIQARLVRLGKKRDEKLLPRIETPPAPAPPTPAPPAPAPPTPAPTAPAPPAPAPPVVTPVPPPPARTAAEARPGAVPKAPAAQKRPTAENRSASDILQRFQAKEDDQRIDRLIEEKVGRDVLEGHDEGHAQGTEITGRLQADYNDLVGAKIRAVYELPDTITDEERVRLEGFLFLRIGARGQLLEARVDQASGNAAFDNAMVAAAKKSAPLPPPPIPLRDFYEEGISFRFRP